MHDIGNLVLTLDNSSYKNFEFSRKKGTAGVGPSYSNSDIRQERKLATFDDWTPKEFEQRRGEISTWINDRWKTAGGQGTALDLSDEPDEDEVEALLEGMPL